VDLKRKALELLERAYKEKQVFVQGLSDEERSAVDTPEQWIAKDVIAHVAAWKERTARELATVARGVPSPDFGSLAQFNARIFQEHRSLTWSGVLNKSRQAHRLLQEQTEAMPKVLTDSKVLNWHGERIRRLIVVRGYTHSLGHLAQWYRERGDVDFATGIQEDVASMLLKLTIAPSTDC
jgi:hypothetical protein